MSEEGLETFVVRGTNSDLDELAVVCGPPVQFIQKDPDSTFGKKVIMYPFIRFGHDQDDETALIDGLWIEEKYLINNPDEIFETTRPGKYVRQLSVHAGNHELVLVEYEDRLQVAVVWVNSLYPEQGDTTLLSTYKEKKHFGSIQLLMNECYDNDDIKEFMKEIREL